METHLSIRPEIMKFALEMERVMRNHDLKKGDSWKTMDLYDIIGQIHEGVDKARTAQILEDISDEAADIANYAMFLYYAEQRHTTSQQDEDVYLDCRECINRHECEEPGKVCERYHSTRESLDQAFNMKFNERIVDLADKILKSPDPELEEKFDQLVLDFCNQNNTPLTNEGFLLKYGARIYTASRSHESEWKCPHGNVMVNTYNGEEMNAINKVIFIGYKYTQEETFVHGPSMMYFIFPKSMADLVNRDLRMDFGQLWEHINTSRLCPKCKKSMVTDGIYDLCPRCFGEWIQVKNGSQTSYITREKYEMYQNDNGFPDL